MATSASRISSSAEKPPPWLVAIPTLTYTATLSEPTPTGRTNASMIRRATSDRGRLGVVGVLDHDRELVAAQAGDHVLGPQARAQARGDRDQQLVAGGVAEAVVDRLEVVEVDEQHGSSPRALAIASLTLSVNSARLARLVSGSW